MNKRDSKLEIITRGIIGKLSTCLFPRFVWEKGRDRRGKGEKISVLMHTKYKINTLTVFHRSASSVSLFCGISRFRFCDFASSPFCDIRMTSIARHPLFFPRYSRYRANQANACVMIKSFLCDESSVYLNSTCTRYSDDITSILRVFWNIRLYVCFPVVVAWKYKVRNVRRA